jgi:predicted nucleotide-binding protein (sugar kinase/HSP70/actin superfamily)
MSKGMAIVYGAVRDILSYKEKPYMNESKAVEMLPKFLEKGISKRLSKEWRANKFEKNYDLVQSDIANVYFNIILNIGDKSFTHIPSARNIK